MTIAMWSGPRNISTAMMRSWGSRDDTAVVDEPLYAHYLANTDYDHPGKAEILAAYETDWRTVVAGLTGPPPDGKRLYFQKHMAHHLLPSIERDWILGLKNFFLIRDPAKVVVSFSKVIPNPVLEQTGFPQQLELFRAIHQASGVFPPVVDSEDILRNPRGVLSALCDRLGVPFQEQMLAWEPGARATDGIWAEHWYANVENSTGFAPYREQAAEVPAPLLPLVDQARAMVEEMAAHKIAP